MCGFALHSGPAAPARSPTRPPSGSMIWVAGWGSGLVPQPGEAEQKGRPRMATALDRFRQDRWPVQAAVLIFSIATATRFETGCAASPASLMNASVFFEVSATIESNALRT